MVWVALDNSVSNQLVVHHHGLDFLVNLLSDKLVLVNNLLNLLLDKAVLLNSLLKLLLVNNQFQHKIFQHPLLMFHNRTIHPVVVAMVDHHIVVVVMVVHLMVKVAAMEVRRMAQTVNMVVHHMVIIIIMVDLMPNQLVNHMASNQQANIQTTIQKNLTSLNADHVRSIRL